MSSQLSLSTYFSLLKLLATCVRSSSAVSQTLLQAGVLDTLTQLLASSSMLSSGGGPATSSVVRSVDQLHDVLLLLADLLPAIPDAPSALQQGVPLAEYGAGALSPSTGERQAFLASSPQLLSRFSGQLLPLLLQLHATTALSQVRFTQMGCNACWAQRPSMSTAAAAGAEKPSMSSGPCLLTKSALSACC